MNVPDESGDTGITRRRVVSGALWSVPVIALSVPALVAAASANTTGTPTTTTLEGAAHNATSMPVAIPADAQSFTFTVTGGGGGGTDGTTALPTTIASKAGTRLPVSLLGDTGAVFLIAAGGGQGHQAHPRPLGGAGYDNGAAGTATTGGGGGASAILLGNDAKASALIVAAGGVPGASLALSRATVAAVGSRTAPGAAGVSRVAHGIKKAQYVTKAGPNRAGNGAPGTVTIAFSTQPAS